MMQPQRPTAQRPSGKPPAAPPPPPLTGAPYKAHTFTITLPDGWKDRTIFTLTGPVEDGIQHNVVIMVDDDCTFESVVDYADWQIRALEDELRACRLLKKGKKTLTNGMPAYEAIFRWEPTDSLRLYQHQIYAVVGTMGYKATASFTKKTRKTLGPKIERMMLSLLPAQASGKK